MEDDHQKQIKEVITSLPEEAKKLVIQTIAIEDRCKFQTEHNRLKNELVAEIQGIVEELIK